MLCHQTYLLEYHISNSNYWPSKALEYTLHCFLLFRLQPVYEPAQQSLFIAVQIPAAIVVSFRDTDTAAIPLYRKDGCGTAERLDVPENRTTADTKLCHEIGDRFLPPVRQQFQHGLSPFERTLHFHTPFRFGSSIIEFKGLT